MNYQDYLKNLDPANKKHLKDHYGTTDLEKLQHKREYVFGPVKYKTGDGWNNSRRKRK